MSEATVSVTEVLRPLADAKQQFVSTEEAWEAFLQYLQARRGAEIGGARGQQDVRWAVRYIRAGNIGKAVDDDEAAWFYNFERRSDVLAALGRFLRDRRLPVPPGL